MVKEGRRIAATAFICPKWSTASRMVYVSLFRVYIASDEGLRSLIHASLTKSCQSLCLHDFISRICMARVHVPLIHIYLRKHKTSRVQKDKTTISAFSSVQFLISTSFE